MIHSNTDNKDYNMETNEIINYYHDNIKHNDEDLSTIPTILTPKF